MKHVIIGTAGHVDHGKTLLIKALTGIETDRLIEEKKRGITIELGFAHIDWEDGLQAGIVDVPGHEKFIKNMLSGAGGIDFAMLVVAADEGFMPQTVEHLDILTLLGIRDGVVVITKCDMVDEEWLMMMREEVAERVKGTFLEGKPIMEVSAYTGQGIGELREKLHDLVQSAQEKSTRIPFRLPIDRVFSVDGFGTVVTGTLIEGAMHEGDSAELVPSGTETRIRNLQVHGKDVETAYAGQRVAVNLAGLKKTDIRRGDTVAKLGSVRVSRMLDVRLECLRDSKRTITNDMQVHLFHGASVLLAKVVLLDRESLSAGESGYAQLRLAEPIGTKNGDRFVIRFYSPLETIGGGVILDDSPVRHKRGDQKAVEALKIKESGSGAEQVVQVLREFALQLPTLEKLGAKLGMDVSELEGEMQQLLAQGRVCEALPGRFVAAAALDTLGASAKTLLGDYHAKNPLHAGIKAAELRQKLFRAMDQTAADALLRALCEEGSIKRVAERYALADFEVHYTKRQSAIREKLLGAYRKAALEPGTTDEMLSMFEAKEMNDAKQVLESAMTGGELILLVPGLCWHKETYERVVDVVKAHFEANETLTLAELRDALGTSRKFALAVLEYFDRNRITKKEGDFRRLWQGF